MLAHNYYRSSYPSGENEVFRCESEMLRYHGHDVVEFTTRSDDLVVQGKLGVLKGAITTPWNTNAALRLRKRLDCNPVDVVHVHNTFPTLSPAIFYGVGHRAARVLTLHNYRLFCSAAIVMRNGEICTDCLDRRSVVPSLVHGCYRSSRIATTPLAIGIGLHRILRTWDRQVEIFICLSDFQKKLMISAGLPEEKIHIKPNFVSSASSVLPWSEREPYVVFVGRLGAEKGAIALLRAWQLWGSSAPQLRIVGDGILRDQLENMGCDLNVQFLGQLSVTETKKQIAQSCLLIQPSECFETFGLSIVEAFAHGTPAAVSNIGSFPSIVEHGGNGIVFRPGDPQSLLLEVKLAWETPGMLKKLGANALATYWSRYTEELNYSALMEIYRRAIEQSQSKNL